MQFDSPALKVLDAVTSGTSAEFGLNNTDEVAVTGEWGAGVGAGAFVLETAPYGGYAGTWSPVSTLTFSGTAPNLSTDSAVVNANVGRVRVTTPVTGGTLTVWINRKMKTVY